MKKNSIILLILPLFLFSCFWSNDEETKIEWLILYNWENYDINIPSDWNIITKESNILPTPKTSKIELAISSDELKYWFANNMLILSQKLNKNISSTDFSILNNVWSSKEYKEYLKLESKNIEFTSWWNSNIYLFEAKYNIETPKFKYIQTWVVCNNTWYLITIALSTEVKDTTKYQEIIKSFKCK